MAALTRPPGKTLASVGPSGELTVWRAADGSYGLAPPGRRRLSLVTFLIGAVLTAVAAFGVWRFTHPIAIVSTRIVADAQNVADAQSALAQTALKIPLAPDLTVGIEQNGAALSVTVQNADEAAARRRVRTVVDSILRVPVASPHEPASVAEGPDPLAKLLTDRAQLVSAIDAVDAQSAAASARLTSLVRDIAAASRANAAAAAAANAASAERRPGHETIDKSAAMLAELQLQLIELKNKFQDDYPAVLAVQNQIRSLRNFMAEESRRVMQQPLPAPPKLQPDPADTLLDQERERLTSEMVDLDARRATMVAQVAAVDRDIAARPTQADLAASRAQPPAAVLVEASTTVRSSPDQRQHIIPAVVGAGLLASLALAFLRGRRDAVPGSLKLYRIEDFDGALPPPGKPAQSRLS